MIFMGAGEHTSRLLQKRYDSYKVLFEHIGGLQQPDHSESEEGAAVARSWRVRSEEQLKKRLEAFVKQLGEDFDIDVTITNFKS